MRRYNRGGAGGTMHAPKTNGTMADPISVIRSFDSEAITTRPVRPSPLSASTIQGFPLDLFDRLRSFPLFQAAPDSFLLSIGSYLQPKLYSANEYILSEGDDAKAIYWLVRGGLKVTSRDGESTYAELKPGAFFGEIGILMDIPRTATVIARLKSLVVRLNKEDLQKVLPNYPAVEQAIRDEVTERLEILRRKKDEITRNKSGHTIPRAGKRPRDSADGDVIMAEAGMLRNGEAISNKKRKSPSPTLADTLASSALGTSSVSVRQLVKELPLFTSLPTEILHFIGLNAQPKSYDPFEDIVVQGSTGRDVFFIVSGEVEVVVDSVVKVNGALTSSAAPKRIESEVKARLKAGQYFGEVTSLSLALVRTATVRSVSSVECLMISGDILDELWSRCGPELRRQVERTAKERRGAPTDADARMPDADTPPSIMNLHLDDKAPLSPRSPLPSVTFASDLRLKEDRPVESIDPDPYLNIDLENVRSRSRRGSLAPPSPSSSQPHDMYDGRFMEPPKSPLSKGFISIPPFTIPRSEPSSPRKPVFSFKRLRVTPPPKYDSIGLLPDTVLVNIFKHLDIYHLMRLRLVSLHWMKLLSTSNDLLHNLDLTPYNKYITDSVIVNTLCPFIGDRPKKVDISNCFHLTDEGFTTLAATCATSVRSWRMKSVWDITGQAVLEMVNKAKGLEDVDLSNCRKVGDNLLARVVGWVVPDLPPQQSQTAVSRRFGGKALTPAQQQQQQQQAIPGTVIGCPKLKRLTLSYCKHITDKSMAHIAVHASTRLEEMDLTRCTTITDLGFQHWSIYPFPRLTKLCLADCTYLSDQAIVALTNAAKSLKELDLSFCCALSDMATEVLALQCPSLTSLSMAFCGSAISDSSLSMIGRHLENLQYLSVRGCVRVTGMGVEAVVDGCRELTRLDVSQCKNLQRWLDSGGIERTRKRGRKVKFEVVADGLFRGAKV